MENYELCHWGIKGMKWGVRRFQNKDGSLTPAGRKRYDDPNDGEHEDYKRAHSKSVKSMSDQELRDRINRLNMERQALDLERQISTLTPKEKASGESFIKSVGSKVVGPALMDAGRRVLTDFANKKGREFLGLDTADSLSVLKKSVDELNLKKQKRDLESYLNGDDSASVLKKSVDELNLKKQKRDLETALNDDGSLSKLKSQADRLRYEEYIEKVKKERKERENQ